MVRIKYLLLAFVLMGSLPAAAQSSNVLVKDPANRYLFYKSVNVMNASRAMLYDRMKSWVVKDLDPSDTYLVWDETAKDSVNAMAYLQLGDGSGYMNQFVSFRVHLVFRDGEISLWANNFIYHGTAQSTGLDANLPFNKLASLGNEAMIGVYQDFDLRFATIMRDFEWTAESRFR